MVHGGRISDELAAASIIQEDHSALPNTLSTEATGTTHMQPHERRRRDAGGGDAQTVDQIDKRRRTDTGSGGTNTADQTSFQVAPHYMSPVPPTDGLQQVNHPSFDSLPKFFPKLLSASIARNKHLAFVSADFPKNPLDCSLQIRIAPTRVHVIARELFGVTLLEVNQRRYVLDIHTGTETEIDGNLQLRHASPDKVSYIFGPTTTAAYKSGQRYGTYDESTGEAYGCLSMKVPSNATEPSIITMHLDTWYLEGLERQFLQERRRDFM